MKIAIAAPSHVPYVIGGAEKLWWGFQDYLNSHTTHQCEIIKITTREHSFWDLIRSYYKFYTLDLSHFDAVITGKYPAWMVRHPNHHIYMLHCLRGLYDSDCSSDPFKVHEIKNHKIRALLDRIEAETLNVENLFEELFALEIDQTIPVNVWAVPGFVVRKIVRYLDKMAMQRVRTFSAISKTVASRRSYFPLHANVRVIYPASNLKHFRNESCKYFLAVSRLDAPKRVDAIIGAYKRSNTTVPLKIAGSGPLEDEIRRLAAGDSRIEVLGFVSDEELIDYYANAYAVIFVPKDEDYGLITVEAMMSEKAVITFSDAGGVLEFVRSGENGYICRPNVVALKEAIEAIASRPDVAVQMGKAARMTVEGISWKRTVLELLEHMGMTRGQASRRGRQVTVITTYPIHPPRGGGQNRIFYLYKELAKAMRVEVISLGSHDGDRFLGEIGPDLLESRVPKTREFLEYERDMESKVGVPVTDIVMLTRYDNERAFIEEIRRSAEKSDYIICAHPYTYPLVKKYVQGRLIYDSHNVEYVLKKHMLHEYRYAAEVLQEVFKAERELCEEATLVAVCSADDAEALMRLYGVGANRILHVPNGVDLGSVRFTGPQERQRLKKQVRMESTRIAVFIGSGHKPNVEAVENILGMAKENANVAFLILGGVAHEFRNVACPANVGFMGMVDDDVKKFVLSIADVALNPMISGSGTNLKMPEYMAAGLPVISTPIGARGLNLPEDLIAVCDVRDFGRFLGDEIVAERVGAAREFVENHFSWEKISAPLRDFILRDL